VSWCGAKDGFAADNSRDTLYFIFLGVGSILRYKLPENYKNGTPAIA
jgi:hypothetical protein